MGSIYKDQFDEYQISNNKFFGLLENHPTENLIPPSKYFIHKNFLSLDSVTKAEQYKKDIIVNHRNSKYAEILLDPTTISKEKQNSNEIYERLYIDFNDQKYVQVID